MYCRTCSYDLKSLLASACPECGRAFDRDDPSTFDSRTRKQRLLIRLAASLAISALCFGTMIAGAWIASGLEFRSFHAAVFAHVSLGATCALITAIAAARTPSWIARAILLVGGVLSMWPTLLLGFDRGYRVWQAQPDPPDEAFADGGPTMGAIFLGWIPSGMWWLASFGVALVVVRQLRRRSNARRAVEAGVR
jgi:hypothetical protein